MSILTKTSCETSCPIPSAGIHRPCKKITSLQKCGHGQIYVNCLVLPGNFHEKDSNEKITRYEIRQSLKSHCLYL